jgi:hypothetical protein
VRTGGGQPTRQFPSPGRGGGESDRSRARVVRRSGPDRRSEACPRHRSGGAWTSARGTSPCRKASTGVEALPVRKLVSLGRRTPTPAVTCRHSDQVCVIDASRRKSPHRALQADLQGRRRPVAWCPFENGRSSTRIGGLLARKGAGWLAERAGCVRCSAWTSQVSASRARRDRRELAGAGSSMSVSDSVPVRC